MRTGLVLASALTLLAPAALHAADPPIVYQTQPLGRILTDTRSAVRLIGGDPAVQGFNNLLRKRLGEKGFDGLDLNRPIVGYVLIPANPEDAVAVVALPVTSEKEFLDLCERANGSKPESRGNGLYGLPPLVPELKAACRVVNGYAYIATAVKDPSAALDPAAIVPANKLFDATEQSLFTGRMYFDRLPPGAREKALELIAGAKGMGLPGGPPELGEVTKRVFEEFSKLGKRYIELSKDAKEVTVRLNLDTRTGDVSVEATLNAKPGSPLDKIIANKKPTVNKFGALLTPDTVVGFKTRLPFFNDELRNSAVIGLEELRKNIPVGGSPAGKDALDELVKGLIRTVKTGEVDVVAAIRGPDRKGLYSAVAVVAFDDPSALEKAFKKFVDAEGPDQFKKNLTWDAAKVGNVGIHTVKFGENDIFIQELKNAFGDDPAIAFAFAPNGIFVTVGQNPIAVMKEALAVKPGPSPVLDVVINPSRLGKFAEAVGGDEGRAMIVRAFGTDDKLLSAMSLTVEGGKELKVRFTVSLKLFPREALTSGLDIPPDKEADPLRK